MHTGTMWCGLLLLGFLAAGTWAFRAAPIRWAGLSDKRLVLASTGSLDRLTAPQQLTLKEKPGRISPDEIPYFTANPDSTITCGAIRWCLEAGGAESGYAVRINHCIGTNTQKWNWLPWGPIQLEGTNQCISVDDSGGVTGALVELRECANEARESWAFEDVIPMPTPSPLQHSSAVIFSINVLVVITLSLAAWLWRWRKEVMYVASPGRLPIRVDQGGVCLSEPIAAGNSELPGLLPIISHHQYPMHWHGLPVESAATRPSIRRATSTMFAAKKKQKGTKKKASSEYITIEPDGDDIWRAAGVIEVLREGGVGAIPTDTGYSFVTAVSSQVGVQRILKLKGVANERKPLSLLCADFKDIGMYARPLARSEFKLVKRVLPGPYTFILEASRSLPKVIYEEGKRKWKRKTIGIRMPNDPVAISVLEQLDEPLLASSVQVDENIGTQLICNIANASGSWCQEVDFILDAGDRSVDASTIYDLSQGELELVREGQGALLE